MTDVSILIKALSIILFFLTKQPPAKAGGFKLSAESTDTGRKTRLWGVDLELTIGIRFKMMLKVILDHFVGNLSRRNTEISPGPKMPTPVPFLDHGEFLEQFGESPPFDPSHDFAWSHYRRRRHENMDMILAEHPAENPNFKGIAGLADQFPDRALSG